MDNDDSSSMDGATNMNVSNAPPAITAGEAKKLKKAMAKDAAAAEKHVSQVSKSLRSAEKDEIKAEKVKSHTHWRRAVADVVITTCRRSTAPRVCAKRPYRSSSRRHRCLEMHSTSTTLP